MAHRKYRKGQKYTVTRRYCFIPSVPTGETDMVCMRPGAVGEVFSTMYLKEYGQLDMVFEQDGERFFDSTSPEILSGYLRKAPKRKRGRRR